MELIDRAFISRVWAIGVTATEDMHDGCEDAATQWFASVEGFIEAAMNAINQIVWTPYQLHIYINGT